MMKPVEIKVKIDILRRELKYWEDVFSTKKCGTCDNFRQQVCTLAGIAPPDDVRATGCPEWVWDDIPF